MATLKVKAGDTISRTVTIKDSSGNAIDITGGTVKIKIVNELGDTDAQAIHTSTLTLSDPTNGVATWSVDNTTSSAWPKCDANWEVEYIDSSGNYSHTDYGPCVIQKSIFTNG